MGSGAGLSVDVVTSRFSTLRDSQEGDGAVLPKREIPSIADAGADAVNVRGSTKSN